MKGYLTVGMKTQPILDSIYNNLSLCSILELCSTPNLCLNSGGTSEPFDTAPTLSTGHNGTIRWLDSKRSQKLFNLDRPLIVKCIEIGKRQRRRQNPTIYSCPRQSGEILISCLASRLVTDDVSPHFVQQWCILVHKQQAYMISEFCGNRRKSWTLQSIQDVTPQVDTHLIRDIVFQVLHSLMLLQDQYGIVHYDLKLDNVFLAPVTENDTFRGQCLSDVDYWAYGVGDKTYYIRNRGFIPKIGDFGNALADCVPNSMGGYSRIVPASYHDQSLCDDYGIEDRFKPGYDTHFFLPQVWFLCESLNIDAPYSLIQYMMHRDILISSENHRPVADTLLKDNPAQTISSISWDAEMTRIPPDGSKILYIG